MAKSKKKYYAVKVGRKPGIYTKWFGNDGAEPQIKGFSGAIYKSFASKTDAELFLKDQSKPEVSTDIKVIIYTDGACNNNPGPGGYGVVLNNGKKSQ